MQDSAFVQRIFQRIRWWWRIF